MRRPEDLVGCDGFVLPGGESTAQSQLMESVGLDRALEAFIARGHPVLATCAGLVLVARHLGVTVERNAWGPQVDSFEATSDDGGLHLVLIRAPRIREVGPGVQILARYAGEPVLVRSGSLVGATFHPELTADTTVHRLAFA